LQPDHLNCITDSVNYNHFAVLLIQIVAIFMLYPFSSNRTLSSFYITMCFR